MVSPIRIKRHRYKSTLILFTLVQLRDVEYFDPDPALEQKRSSVSMSGWGYHYNNTLTHNINPWTQTTRCSAVVPAQVELGPILSDLITLLLEANVDNSRVLLRREPMPRDEYPVGSVILSQKIKSRSLKRSYFQSIKPVLFKSTVGTDTFRK